MSAIFGLARLGGGTADDAELERMQRTLAHRGPDGQARLTLGAVGVGHCLLKVNREDRFEAQPLHDRAHGLTLVADLRLDNREELAGQCGIDAASLGTMSDSAVLLSAWVKWGVDCLEHLLGDFTIAVWNHREGRLYLARDGMGQRGLYYHHASGLVAFASEVKALWAISDVPRKLNETGIAYRLLGPVDPDPDLTLFEGISILPGGQVHVFEADKPLEKRRFWDPSPDPRHLGQDDAYYLSTYRQVVEEAIACRVRRLEQPPCLMFSGGFDSGTIAAFSAPYAARQGKAVTAVASVVPAGVNPGPLDARRAASAFEGMPGLDIHWFARSNEHYFIDLEQGFAELDDCQPHDYVRRAAYALGRSAGARLALDGHGGDYTVNHIGAGMLGRILLRGRIGVFLRELRLRRMRSGQGLGWILTYDVVRPLLPAALLRLGSLLVRGMTPIWRTRMARDDFAARIIAQGRIDPRRLRDPRVLHGRWAERSLHMIERARSGFPQFNTMAGQAGLDFSRPFHDRRVVELGLAIPERLQLKDGLERWLARNALVDVLPRTLIESRPGNTAERPGVYAMLLESAPTELENLITCEGASPATRYVDFNKLRNALLPGEGGLRIGHEIAVSQSAATLIIARFINWFERANARDQEP